MHCLGYGWALKNENTDAGINLQRQLKTLLVALIVLVGQTLAISEVTAHELDPGHASDECLISIAVQTSDSTTPPALQRFEAPPAVSWTVGETATNRAVLKALSGISKARAPPL